MGNRNENLSPPRGLPLPPMGFWTKVAIWFGGAFGTWLFIWTFASLIGWIAL